MWQRMMIALARNEAVTRMAHGSRLLSGLAGRFVGGGDAETVVQTIAQLQASGRSASLFYLGEYVRDPELVTANVTALREGIEALARAGLPVHASVDPTQVGSLVSWEVCEANVRELAESAASRGGVLMLDMEDAEVTAPTLDLYLRLRAEGLPVAITLQAYLHRTAEDLQAVLQLAEAGHGGNVRLVKGAFAEPASLAVQGARARDRAFVQCMTTLLGERVRSAGVYTALGTHDHRMVEQARALADGTIGSNQWEVEMLYGVRPDYQKRLVDEGVAVRLYVPFGTDWWPYSIRRIGETPRNLLFVLRGLV